MATTLRLKKVSAVGLVDRGADPNAHVVIYKRDTGDEVKKAVGDFEAWADAVGATDTVNRAAVAHVVVAKVGRKISAARLTKLKELRGVIDGIVSEQESADAPPESTDQPPVSKGDNIEEETTMAKVAVATLTEGAQYVLKGLNLGAEVDEAQATWTSRFVERIEKADGDLPPAFLAHQKGKKECGVDVDGEPCTLAKGHDGKHDPDGDMPDSLKEKLSKADVAALSEPVRKYLGDWKLAAPTRGDVAFAKRLAGEVDEDVFKGMTPQARQLYLVQKRENDELRAEVRKGADDRQRERYMAEIGALSHLPLKADDHWVILKMADAVVEKVGEQTFGAEIRRVFKAMNEQIRVGGVLKEFGSSNDGGSGVGSAWGQICALASEKVTKSAIPLSVEAARDQVMVENPKLYDQYEAEKKAGRV